MAQTVLITLTTAGSDTGPFDLYSNIDGFTVPFENNVAKLDLEAGYVSVLVPDSASVIRVQSDGPLCDNYIDLSIITTTTTTSSTTTSSTTTTTSTSSTTTTTTTLDCGDCWRLQNESGVSTAEVSYTPCGGGGGSENVGPGAIVWVCSQTEPVCNSGCTAISISLDPGNCGELC